MARLKELKWVKECWDYHSQHISELDIAVDWGDWEEERTRCWCCGHVSTLQKCHIIPKSLGGSDEADNLVPLCASCHDEAPDVSDGQEMFRWIKGQQNPLCGLGLGRYWHLRDVIIECVTKEEGRIDFEILNSCIEKSIEMTSFHFSQSNTGIKMKKSSREWAIKKAFELYAKQVR